ncbi:probable sulfate transporter 3.5 [Argentina anserina]|uniref:probable sulfate transporter 3.5 n=1 Tax=Argentina anserina TaxID=57926 RepID=UPI0021767436|nr:probable sulfate transporter 3.5 [Potentilla anserina]
MAAPNHQKVNFAAPRSFWSQFKSDIKEALFPDDPFSGFGQETGCGKVKKGLQYFVPIFGWIPQYNLKTFISDLVAGITITSLAIPQGISYAGLAGVPPLVGLYTSFVPPLVYAVFGDSKYMAVGNVASASLLIKDIISQVVTPEENQTLFLHMIFTTTLVTGVMQIVMGALRLGIFVDFLSHSTITGFMAGSATIICMQQLKGIFGLTKFTSKTDLFSVVKCLIDLRKEWQWEPAVLGVIFIIFLFTTKWLKEKNAKFFLVQAVGPLVVVIIGCLLAYFFEIDKYHHIPIVGELKRGLNPITAQHFIFDLKLFPVAFKAGTISGCIALAEAIAVGRAFGVLKNENIDGNKEMIALGFMNVIGSCTSCHLSTGPFSKTAVNYNAGAKTQMANAVQAVCMLMVVLLLAPLFGYTPHVALSAIIFTAMIGIIDYETAMGLWIVDKFDFLICMGCYFAVVFRSMLFGLTLSVALGLLRSLLYVARPGTCKLGKLNLSDTSLYRDSSQYAEGSKHKGILVLQIGSPLYCPNGNYVRERILRWVRDEQAANRDVIEHVLLDLSGVVTIDVPSLGTLEEIRKTLAVKGIKMGLINPRIKVLEKMQLSKKLDMIGKENIYLSVEDAVESCRFALDRSTEDSGSSPQLSDDV